MATSNSCGCGSVRTGYDSCAVDARQITKIVITDLIAKDGTPNRIDITDTLDASYFTTLVNESNRTKGVDVISNISDVTYLPKDARNITTKDNTDIFIEDKGVFMFEGTVYGVPTSVIGDWNSLVCGGKGVYYFGLDGNQNEVLIGRSSGDGFVYPKAIQDSTWIVDPIGDKGGDNLNRARIRFQEERTETYKNYSTLTLESGSGNALVGLKEIVLKKQSTTATTIVLKAELLHGSLNDPILYDVADFTQWTLTDTTSGLPVAVTNATIDASCNITLTHAGSTATNTNKLELSANGFYANPLEGVFV